jgi:hypothetical protein
MAINLTLDTVLSRVRIAGTGLAAGLAVFERRVGAGTAWTTVRGGEAVAVTGGAASLDDYEFVPGVANDYRIFDGSLFWQTSITPVQDEVWLKSISRPFLNRPVSVVAHEDISRAARNGIFPIVGRSAPVAITDVRLAREWQMTVKADSVSDADAIELVLAGGDPLFIQVPADERDIPGGYVAVGTMVRRRFGHVSQRRWFDLPCTTIAPPGPGVVGATATWEALVAAYDNWSDVLSAFGSWAAVAEYVADPSTVIVP